MPLDFEPTMDLPTQEHLKTLRGLLEYRRVELRADVHAAEMERQGAGREERDVGDRKDEAMRGMMSMLDGQQEERDRQEMREVEAALQRLDEGTYGDCAACGEPIHFQRLLAQPAATRCAGCQGQFEVEAARAS